MLSLPDFKEKQIVLIDASDVSKMQLRQTNIISSLVQVCLVNHLLYQS